MELITTGSNKPIAKLPPVKPGENLTSLKNFTSLCTLIAYQKYYLEKSNHLEPHFVQYTFLVLEKKGKAASSLKASLDMRPSRLSLKRQGIFKERLFGCDLGEHLQNVGRVGECKPYIDLID